MAYLFRRGIKKQRRPLKEHESFSSCLVSGEAWFVETDVDTTDYQNHSQVNKRSWKSRHSVIVKDAKEVAGSFDELVSAILSAIWSSLSSVFIAEKVERLSTVSNITDV